MHNCRLHQITETIPGDREESNFYNYYTVIFKELQSMQSNRKVWSIYRGEKTETIPE